MKRQRKNAGEGFGFRFHGSFAHKADAVEKEAKVKGAFIKPTEINGERRYTVMSPRTNPPRRRRTPPKPTTRNPHLRFNAEGKGRCQYCGKKRSLFALSGHPQAWQIGLGCRGCLKKQSVSRNPAELLVMGANPPRPPANLPGFPPRMNAGPVPRIGAPRVRPGLGANPSAEALRETFVGAPADTVEVTKEPHMPPGDYAQLGELLALYVKPAGGGQVQTITFPRGDRPMLVCDESARQMYFVGGGQDLSDSLGAFGADEWQGMYLLGDCRRIDYKQRKEHVPDPELDQWKHSFGEENGVLPQLWFDGKAKRLLLQGGDYRIEASGINN
jgi:hypothetical protein